MTTHGDFLKAIIEAPEDDAPRLIYADWLDERGECDRAEFIRAQCEFEHTLCHQPPDPGEQRTARSAYCNDTLCRHCRLGRRANGLLWEQSGGITRSFTALPWLPPGWPLAWEDDETQWEWRRGFVESLTCTAAAWLTHADALTAAAPIREVGLTTWPNVHEYAAARPGMMPSGSPVRFRLPSHGPLELRTTEWLAAEWPHIRFALPPGANWDHSSASSLLNDLEGPSPLRAAYSTYSLGLEAQAAVRHYLESMAPESREERLRELFDEMRRDGASAGIPPPVPSPPP